MHHSHLTLRLSADLARSLDRWADERGLAKSHLVREAIAAYLAAPPAEVAPALTAADLAARWSGLPRLGADEARDLARDVASARRSLPAPRAWD